MRACLLAVLAVMPALPALAQPQSSPGGTMLSAYDFNFAPQTPNVSLSAGVTQAITLSPCPYGVNATDTNHYLYLSGGTGTAEAVSITQSGGAGNCTSGASSGTIKIVPANAHSGAWTIQSDSGGVQETIQAGAKSVYVPPGIINSHSEIYIAAGLTVQCADKYQSAFEAFSATQNQFHVVTTQPWAIVGCTMFTGVTKTAGAAILADTADSQAAVVRNNRIVGHYHGIYKGQGAVWTIEGNTITNWAVNGSCMYLDNGSGAGDEGDHFITGNTCAGALGWVDGDASTGVKWRSGGGLLFHNNNVIGVSTSLDLEPSDGVTTSVFLIYGNSLEGFSNYGIRMKKENSTGSVINGQIFGNEIASSGLGGATTPICVSVEPGFVNVTVANNSLLSCSKAVNVTTTGVTVSENKVLTATTAYALSSDTVLIDHSGDTGGTAFAKLPTSAADGSRVRCSDCKSTNVCSGSGSGAIAVRSAGVWGCTGAHNGTPSISSCTGGSLASGSTDQSGTISSISATTCSLNFAHTWDAAPACVANTNATNVALLTSTSVLSFSGGGSLNTLNYICR